MCILVRELVAYTVGLSYCEVIGFSYCKAAVLSYCEEKMGV